MLGRAGLLMSGAVTQRAVARSISPVKECRRFASGGHGPSYNEPSGTYSCPLTRLGYLFGEKPPAPGTKRVKDAWEMPWYLGMYGGAAVFALVMYFKPDRSVRTWAAPEAEKRLDEAGIEWRYKPSPHSGYPNGIP